MRTSDYSTRSHEHQYERQLARKDDPFMGALDRNPPFDRSKFYRPFGQQDRPADPAEAMVKMQLEWLTEWHTKTRAALNQFDGKWPFTNRADLAETEADVAARTIMHMGEAIELIRQRAREFERAAVNETEMRAFYENEYHNLRRQIDNQLWNRIKRGFKRLFEYPGKLVQGPPGPQGPMGPPGECKCQRDNGAY